MSRISTVVQRFIHAMCLAVLFQACAGATPPLRSTPTDGPDNKSIETFTGGAKMVFPQWGKNKVRVSDRILIGPVGPVTRLSLPDGTAIYWWVKFDEDTHSLVNMESVGIYAPDGRPRLLAAVDDIPWCNGFHCQPFDSMSAYEQNVKQTERSPSISIFVRDKRDINTYLPYLMRWLQANLLGFNVDCKDPRMAEACKAVPQIAETQIPIDAYLLPSMRPLGVPKVKAADIPLEAFTQ